MRTEDELIERVMGRGIGDPACARRAIHATVAVLAECLTGGESEALARCLPAPLARVARDSRFDGPIFAADFYERVRRREGVAPGRSREEAQTVVAEIGELLDPEARRLLARALPEELGELFAPRIVGEPPPHSQKLRGPPIETLASGRPGSRHPVSEAAPERAHQHSVVREANPHGETKLSSAEGTTQERLGDSLAKGRPPAPARPVDEAHDESPAPSAHSVR